MLVIITVVNKLMVRRQICRPAVKKVSFLKCGKHLIRQRFDRAAGVRLDRWSG
jgi:hypothetical protein